MTGLGVVAKVKGLAEAVTETAQRFKAQALPREPRRGQPHAAAASGSVVSTKTECTIVDSVPVNVFLLD